jgi:hypothetical protein
MAFNPLSMWSGGCLDCGRRPSCGCPRISTNNPHVEMAPTISSAAPQLERGANPTPTSLPLPRQGDTILFHTTSAFRATALLRCRDAAPSRLSPLQIFRMLNLLSTRTTLSDLMVALGATPRRQMVAIHLSAPHDLSTVNCNVTVHLRRHPGHQHSITGAFPAFCPPKTVKR